jgi:hydroxyacylglutathione hydrolase
MTVPRPTIEIKLLPILKDNYVPVLIYEKARACVIDPGESQNIYHFLSQENLTLDSILVTHHHADHTGGVKELLNLYPTAQLIKPAPNNFARLDFFEFKIFNEQLQLKCIATPGHTLDHVVYYASTLESLFCGDLIFGLGCGRVFEGTFEQMYNSLRKIKSLPLTTTIYCAHEYTEHNLAFISENSQYLKPSMKLSLTDYTQTVNSLRKNSHPTVPLLLEKELLNNPFFGADSLEEFSFWRRLKG